jgi:endonuclease III
MPAIPKQLSKQNQNNDSFTEKADNLHRVANRLGWVSTKNPDATIKSLTLEAEKMKENVYKYLDSLARLGKSFCKNDKPNCKQCPMNQGCKYHLAHGKK